MPAFAEATVESPPSGLSFEQAVMAYEAEYGTGYDYLTLGQHVYQLQEEGVLSERVYQSEQEVWHEYLRVRTTERLRRLGGRSGRRFVAWATTLMEQPVHLPATLVTPPDEGKDGTVDVPPPRVQYLWGSAAAVRDVADQRAAAVAFSKSVLLSMAPGMIENHVNVLARMGVEVAPLRQEVLAAVAGAFARGADLGADDKAA